VIDNFLQTAVLEEDMLSGAQLVGRFAELIRDT
jgi:hypothetical protein